MPKAKKSRKIRDKWKAKSWLTIKAPSYLGGSTIAEVPVTDPERALGRVVEVTLFDLLRQDPQQYSIKLGFQVEKVNGSIAETVLKRYEYGREYLRSLVRRGYSMVDFIEDYVTKDGYTVRLYVVAFAQARINFAKMHRIRLAARSVLSTKMPQLNYDLFTQELIMGKLGSEVFAEAKKVTYLRHVGVRKCKLVEVHEAAPLVEEAVPVASS